MKTITEKQTIKDNAIRLAKHHKEHCSGPDCNISLYLLRRLIALAGIELSPAEESIFI